MRLHISHGGAMGTGLMCRHLGLGREESRALEIGTGRMCTSAKGDRRREKAYMVLIVELFLLRIDDVFE